MTKPTGGKRGRPKTWTPEQEAYIRQNAGVMFTKDLAFALGKGLDAVHAKARHLGISCRTETSYPRPPSHPRPERRKPPINVTAKDLRVEHLLELSSTLYRLNAL